jgi:Large polyvalent protein-associated domain 7
MNLNDESLDPPASGRTTRSTRRSRRATPENWLGPHSEHRRGPSIGAPQTPQAQRAIPDSVRAHFVQVGTMFHFADGTRAFTDQGTRLSTRSENTQLVKDLVAIAQARGWQSIRVGGTERFRRAAWIAASEVGLILTGFRPNAFERERYARQSRASQSDTPIREADRRPAPKHPATGKPAEWRGTLIDHGPAPYQHDPRRPMSYAVKLKTSEGEREIWGVDLERALKQSLSKPQRGDEVILRSLRQERVTLRSSDRDPDGSGTGERVREARRTRWLIERREFLERREQAADLFRDPTVQPGRASQAHPELIGAYLQLHAAELAAKQFTHEADRQRFIAAVRGTLAERVERGEIASTLGTSAGKPATPNHTAEADDARSRGR